MMFLDGDRRNSTHLSFEPFVLH
ncbi:BgTH12-01706 [Blumeria graminis f. sp. triticale]|uniref:Bgt-51304 n=2 Tax=Blumeria graminis TaxID=34373 RepID=A0A9X9QBY1_BLUGR|nr:BgTH12-01706 [Blumeria graminis f. sp. triticale]VDB83949.1 Bgt-51304 [Blumeria graminis f. sp. tritici]